MQWLMVAILWLIVGVGVVLVLLAVAIAFSDGVQGRARRLYLVAAALAGVVMASAGMTARVWAGVAEPDWVLIGGTAVVLGGMYVLVLAVKGAMDAGDEL